MEAIYTKPSFKTPEIKFNPEDNQFFIKGRSLPEDAREYYEPYKKWLTEYFSEPKADSDFVFELNYFNTSSSKMVLDILYILRNAFNNGTKLNIIWRYEQEDEEMQEAGQDYEAIIKIPIKMECVEQIMDK
jgi:SiaC family regulatory phosphoprotein